MDKNSSRHKESLEIEIGNYELLYASRKIHALLIILDLSFAFTYSTLFILFDRRLKNKLIILILAVTYSFLPIFISIHHILADISLHDADFSLRSTGFTWNRRICGRFTCQRDSVCNRYVTDDQCMAYTEAEKAYEAVQTLKKWLPKDIIVFFFILTIITALQRASSGYIPQSEKRMKKIASVVVIVIMSLFPLFTLLFSQNIGWKYSGHLIRQSVRRDTEQTRDT